MIDNVMQTKSGTEYLYFASIEGMEDLTSVLITIVDGEYTYSTGEVENDESFAETLIKDIPEMKDLIEFNNGQ